MTIAPLAPRVPTTKHLIVLAAATFEADFTIEQLIVRAWERYPRAFALDGYPQYPHSNAVRSKVNGAGGCIARQWIERVGAFQLRVTDAGRDAVRGFESV